MPPTRNCERLDGVVVAGRSGPGTSRALGALRVLLLTLDQAPQLGLELRLLEPRRRQELAEVGTDLGRVRPDRPELGHRIRVVVPLLVAGAPLAPDDEEHHDEDRKGDESDQTQDRRHPVRSPQLRPARAATSSSRRTSGAGAVGGLGFAGCVVFEEVEVENVVVVRAHASAPVRGRGRVYAMHRLGRTACCRGEEAMTVSSTAYAVPAPDLVLDRYRPLRPLGRGGSGSVWLARDERTGLEVALKIVPREGKRASRAAREMEAASRLRHERCVRAYDFGGDSGHVYIAYEYVQGRTMREALRTGKLCDRDAVEAAAQILDALAHAHSFGIVHRDVKPSNVLVEEGSAVSIRLLDFGLAQFDEADTLTAVGDVPGTLAYISPERLGGGDATPASDVWAVGVLLWESLAGEHPFWGVPLPQVAAAIEAGAAPIGATRPDLPPALADAVSSALATEPSKRPTAERLAADLRAALVSPRRDRTAAFAAAEGLGAQARVDQHIPLERHLVPAALTSVTVVLAASLLPFWTPGLVAAAGARRGVATLRVPRLGLAIALFVPVFPLGNVAQAAAVTYAALALGWLARVLAGRARRARVRRRAVARLDRSARPAAPRGSARLAGGRRAPCRRSSACSPPPPSPVFAATRSR